MARWRRVLGAVATLALAGCAAGQGGGPSGTASPPQAAGAYAHRASTAELILYWNCTRPEPEVLRLGGIAQSPWEAEPIGSLRFELVGVDAKGHTISEARAEADENQLGTNQSTPFRLALPTSGREVRFDLFVQYYFTQPTVISQLAGAPVPLPWLLADTMRSVIRDACSETQHLVR